MAILSIEKLKGKLKGKKVLVRVGYDVPFDDKGRITDDSRIRASVPTLEFLHEEGAKIILLSHAGRPEGRDPKLTLEPCMKALYQLITPTYPNIKVLFVGSTMGKEVDKSVGKLKDGQILLLENVRFEKGEDKANPEYEGLCSYLANLADAYVNDAFSVSHRASASMVGIPEKMKAQKKPVCAGLQTMQEIDMLKPLLKPKGYSVAIVGGAKVKDKIKTIKTLVTVFSKVLLGGGMANTFLAATGKNVGKSRVETEFLEEIKALLASDGGKRILLPKDGLKGKLLKPEDKVTAAVATGTTDFAKDAPTKDELVLDIDHKTIAYFREEIKKADTVFWNGPVGVFESETFRNGTLEIGKAMAECRGYTVVGGGDTAAALELLRLRYKMKWVSTGGGASQEYVENKGHLPALDVLE